jgi:hypothetical protein
MPAYSITVERTCVDRGSISVIAATPEEAQEQAMQWARQLRRAGVFHKMKTTAKVLSTELQLPTKEQSPD